MHGLMEVYVCLGQEDLVPILACVVLRVLLLLSPLLHLWTLDWAGGRRDCTL